jgi:predicted ATPase
MIENPEAHLHPRGQTKMAELMSLAVSTGVQVVVETHSDHILNAVRLAVKRKMLVPENVKIHFATRSGDSNVFVSPRVDADGRVDSWPKGFFDEMDMVISDLIT